MDVLARIDIEWIALGLAGLVLVQLVVELSGLRRRSDAASGRGVFLQVQGRRLPAAGAEDRMPPIGRTGTEGVRQ
jgi:hypothetical protein